MVYYGENIMKKNGSSLPFERVEKSTHSPPGMPLARKSKIFGLRSIPANTTPVSLKNRYILRFFAYKVFFRRACQRKNRKCSITDERVDFEVYRQTETAEMICTPKVRHFWRCIFLWVKEKTKFIVQNLKSVL